MSQPFDILQQLVLPAALFAVMITVGMELTRRDFRDVVAAPRAVLGGMAIQAAAFVHRRARARRRAGADG